MAEHGIVGEDYGTDLPQTQVPDGIEAQRQLNELKNMAKFSRTAEFKRLKDHIEAKIKFYQQYLPGTQVSKSELDDAELGQRWRAASTIIEEMQEIITSYEQATQIVQEK